MKIVVWGMVGMCLGVAPGLAAQNQGNYQLTEKLIIGRAETARLSDWGIALKARIDTGAYRTAVHVDRIEPLGGDPEWIRFETRDRHGQLHTVEARVVRYVTVTSSFGHKQQRPLIRTRLCLAGQEFETVVTLADRSAMRFPMLIGRLALEGRFLIDPAQRHASSGSCSASVEAAVPAGTSCQSLYLYCNLQCRGEPDGHVCLSLGRAGSAISARSPPPV